ncbi:hypothetical protein D3C80_1234950 [compost metagenome]
MFLCKIAQLHRLSKDYLSPVRLQLPCNHIQKRRFTASVRPNYTNSISWHRRVGQVLYQHALASLFLEVSDLHNFTPKSGRGDRNVKRIAFEVRLGRLKLFKAFNPCLLLGRTRFGSAPNPGQLGTQ